MKTNLFLFCILLMLMPRVYATDRVVTQGSVAGAYATVSAAIAAAASGDRVLIFPGVYTENVTVNKNNLMVLTATQGQTYTIQGSLTFTGTGNNWMACQLNGNIVDNGNTNRIAGCNISGTISCSPSVVAYLDADGVNPGFAVNNNQPAVIISRGRISGCFIGGTQGILVKSSLSPGNDTMLIVGNIMYLDGTVPQGIEAQNPQQFLYIANNYMNIINPVQNSGSFILVDSLKSSPTIYNAIVNNSCLSSANGSSYDLAVGFALGATGGTLDVENNLFLTRTAFALNVYLSSFQLIYRYNQSNLSNNLSGIDGSNIYNAANGVTIENGDIFSGPGVHGGNPALSYLNLDLSTNKVGCYGGSYSLANFYNSDNGARVLFMKAPRVVIGNQSIGISADCLAK